MHRKLYVFKFMFHELTMFIQKNRDALGLKRVHYDFSNREFLVMSALCTCIILFTGFLNICMDFTFLLIFMEGISTFWNKEVNKYGWARTDDSDPWNIVVSVGGLLEQSVGSLVLYWQCASNVTGWSVVKVAVVILLLCYCNRWYVNRRLVFFLTQ